MSDNGPHSCGYDLEQIAEKYRVKQIGRLYTYIEAALAHCNYNAVVH